MPQRLIPDRVDTGVAITFEHERSDSEDEGEVGVVQDRDQGVKQGLLGITCLEVRGRDQARCRNKRNSNRLRRENVIIDQNIERR